MLRQFVDIATARAPNSEGNISRTTSCGGITQYQDKIYYMLMFYRPETMKERQRTAKSGKKAQWLKKKKFRSLVGIADEIKGKANQTSLKGMKCTTSRDQFKFYKKESFMRTSKRRPLDGVEKKKAKSVCSLKGLPSRDQPAMTTLIFIAIMAALINSPPLFNNPSGYKGPQLAKLIVLENLVKHTI